MRVWVLALAALLGVFAAAPARAADAQELVDRAAVGDMFEVQASRMALHLSRDDAVRDFARRTIVETNEAMVALKRTADAAGLAFPERVDGERGDRLQSLMKAGDGFTPRYLQALEAERREVLQLFESYAAKGGDARVRTFARGALPDMRTRLATLRALR
ncbi:exported hypothetical protein [uncultured Alphaproteobacteria bacterium]|uniref:DUF4142 domain-containing protein n=1 Tax=uncultured Alphaproteobacteria bacterium TaxID=91750 RepID=A0A212KKJ4_9PROT|nr:exported hypothetical protein [uncultured Alphaproteobacteria bacterium]